MTTMLRKGVIGEVNRLIMENSPMVAVIEAYYRDLLLGVYPSLYVDCIVQGDRDSRPLTIYDAFCFAHVHCALMSGDVAIFAIPVGSVPLNDVRCDEINAALTKLPPPFTADFHGGFIEGQDGTLKWDRPIRAVITHQNQSRRGIVIVPPSEACPLEVGSTESEKTAEYLSSVIRESHGGQFQIARWPYGSDHIFVFTADFRTLDNVDFDTLASQCLGSIEDTIVPYALMAQGQ